MKVYPRWKVFFGFLLCPPIAGISYAMFLTIEGVLLQNEALDFSSTYFVFLLLIAIGSFGFYSVPAALLGIVYAYFKLFKGWRSFLFVFFFSGLTAHFWGVIIDAVSRNNEGFPYVLFGGYTPALLAGFSSLFVSFVVLPKKHEFTNTERMG